MSDKVKIEKESFHKGAFSPSQNILYGLRNVKSHNSDKKHQPKQTPLKSPTSEMDLPGRKINSSSKLNILFSNCIEEKNTCKSPSDKVLLTYSGRKTDHEKETFSSKMSKLKFDILNSSNSKEFGRYTPVMTQNDKKESKLSRKISVNLYDCKINDYQVTEYSKSPITKNKALTTLLKVSSFKNVCSSKGKPVRSQNKIISPPNKIKKTFSNNQKLDILSISNTKSPQPNSKLQRFKMLQFKMENYIVI